MKRAAHEARRIADTYPCADRCGGTYVDITYRHWFCQEDDAVEIQLQWLCYVA